MPINPDALNLPKKRVFKKQAALWKRLLAFVIDILVIQLVIGWPFRELLGNLEKKGLGAILASESSSFSASVVWAMYIMIILSWLYFSLFEYYLRQTIGMTVMGIYVDGEVTFFKALVRNCFLCPLPIVPIIWVIELFYLIFFKFRLSERLTDTNTVEVLQAY